MKKTPWTMNGIFKGDCAMFGKGGYSRNKISKYICSLLGLVVLLSLIPLYMSPSAAAQDSDKVFVEFDFKEVSKDIEVGPGDPCLVQFKGKARIKSFIPQGRQVLVSLSCDAKNVDTARPSLDGWSAVVTPPIIIFDPTILENEITVTVQCAQYEYMNAMADIIIGGRWQNNPGGSGKIKDFSLTAVAAQYSMIRLNSPHSFNTGYPGQQRQYTLEVTNEGNGVDWFDIRITNEDTLEDTDFVVLRETRITEKVQPGETANFTFDIIGPRTFTLFRSRISEVSIEVTSVSSENQGSPETMSYSVFYQEKGTYYDISLCMGAMAFISIMLLLPFYLYKHVVRKRRFRQEVIRSLEEEGLL
jgi:hypothetical protein